MAAVSLLSSANVGNNFAGYAPKSHEADPDETYFSQWVRERQSSSYSKSLQQNGRCDDLNVFVYRSIGVRKARNETGNVEQSCLTWTLDVHVESHNERDTENDCMARTGYGISTEVVQHGS